ncbi:hypothetical protein C8R43DRAFT_941006 [Mycena crocata]|nr:hypothetical protein C8R43DRAFT_941006 [Mycena crocata]
MENHSGGLGVYLLALAVVFWAAHRLRTSRKLVSTLPGPKSPSWVYGICHRLALLHFQPLAGYPQPGYPQLLLSKEYGEYELEFQWQQMYGPVYAIKACFGASFFFFCHLILHFSNLKLPEERRLMVSDPAAIKHVLNNPVFVHGVSQRKAADVLYGTGNLVMAEDQAKLSAL